MSMSTTTRSYFSLSETNDLVEDIANFRTIYKTIEFARFFVFCLQIIGRSELVENKLTRELFEG